MSVQISPTKPLTPISKVDETHCDSKEGGDAIDPAEEKKLLRKLDLHVVPPLLIFYMLAFLDRVNIGNAKIQNMTKELHMVNQNYNVALFIFFIPWVLCQA